VPTQQNGPRLFFTTIADSDVADYASERLSAGDPRRAFSGPLQQGPGPRVQPVLRYLTQTDSVPLLINAPPLSEKETAGRSGSQTSCLTDLPGYLLRPDCCVLVQCFHKLPVSVHLSVRALPGWPADLASIPLCSSACSLRLWLVSLNWLTPAGQSLPRVRHAPQSPGRAPFFYLLLTSCICLCQHCIHVRLDGCKLIFEELHVALIKRCP
jgi:hypothetical protein